MSKDELKPKIISLLDVEKKSTIELIVFTAWYDSHSIALLYFAKYK